MPEQLSTVLGVTSDALEQQGAFNGFYAFDSQFHIDPALLRGNTPPELRTSAARLEAYFASILRLLSQIDSCSGPIWEAAVALLTIEEINAAALGYSSGKAAGRAFGRPTAEGTARIAHQIITAGVKDPVVFELVGLLQEGVGADLISDLTLAIILPDIAEFNKRVIANLGLQSVIRVLRKTPTPFARNSATRFLTTLNC